MRPWHVSIGLTVTALGVAVAIFGLPELAFYKPHWSVLFRRGGLPIAVYGGIAVASFAFSIYAAARSLGLADLGRKVDLVERTIRRGEGGDSELAEALQNQAKGNYQD